MPRPTSIAMLTICLVTSAGFTAQVLAKPAPWYEVEVFVFEHPNQTSEQWSDEVILPKTQGAVDFITPAITTEISAASVGLSTSSIDTPLCDTDDWKLKSATELNSSNLDNSSINENMNSQNGSYTGSRYGVIDSSTGLERPTDNKSEFGAQLNSKTDACREQFSQATQSRLQQVPLSIAANIEKQAIWGTQHQLLAESQSQFSKIINKINRESGTKPLLHMTWQQVMLPRHRAKPVRLFAGKDFSKNFHLNGTAIDHNQQDLLSQFGFLQNYFTPKQDIPVWKLDGLFNIYLNHYLYVETQLNYRDQGIRVLEPEDNIEKSEISTSTDAVITQEMNDTIAPTSEQAFLYAIPMVQNRRVRSSEIHYLDHPKLGIVFQIRKMLQPEEQLVPAVADTAQLPESTLSNPPNLVSGE